MIVHARKIFADDFLKTKMELKIHQLWNNIPPGTERPTLTNFLKYSVYHLIWIAVKSVPYRFIRSGYMVSNLVYFFPLKYRQPHNTHGHCFLLKISHYPLNYIIILKSKTKRRNTENHRKVSITICDLNCCYTWPFSGLLIGSYWLWRHSQLAERRDACNLL